MILLYHLVFPDTTPKNTWNAGKVLRLSDLTKHISWLQKRFKILSLEDYLTSLEQTSAAAQRNIAITFDDGYQVTFDLVRPILLAAGVPATFFVTTAHLRNNDLLWFVYINALCFEKVYQSITVAGHTFPLKTEKDCYRAWRKLISLAIASGDATAFSQTYAKSYPLPEGSIHKYMGMTKGQIASFAESPYLELGGHTHSHPYMDQLPFNDQVEEIRQNKHILEMLSGQKLRYFAYTGGVYNADSLDAVKAAGFEAACAIRPKSKRMEEIYELPRTDIYSPSLLKLQVKIFGLTRLAQQVTILKDKPNG